MNPNETRGSEGEGEMEDQMCPRCGMNQKDWTANEGRGFNKEGESYCCQGCAEGTGCTCEETVTAPVKKSSGRKRRM